MATTDTSEKGLALYKDHRYEFVSIYQNPLDHDVDAMSALWMYCRSHQ